MIFIKVFVALFLVFFQSYAFAMTDKLCCLSDEKKQDPLQIPRINPLWLQRNTHYQLHFFWASGVKFEDCTLQGQSTQVKIGAQYSESFQLYLQQLLKDPLVPDIHFVMDFLTFRTNLWLQDLQKRHPSKFFIFFSEEIETQITNDVEAYLKELGNFPESKRLLFFFQICKAAIQQFQVTFIE
ncbi:MAG: hypothetical protein JSS34_04175 [Proteobacteria bacterium]|nr:hypothetical protein [Pseudomonadota bacterium]